MLFDELIKKRQSTRKYLNKAAPRELTDQCLEAARLAPSACNSQPWSFVVADDEKLIQEISDSALSGIYSMNSFSKGAPVMIAIITERSRFSAVLGGLFRGMQYSLIDIGIAAEHICLMAAELGLGTCMLGWFNENAVRKTLKLPKTAKIDLLISMGYPAIDQVREKNRKPLPEMVRYNR